jgi:DNA polymerase-3 subunit chi
MRADFYLLTQADITACLPTLCRILAKAYTQRQSVFVLTQSAQQAQALDELLWTFRDDSFIPHAIVTSIDSSDVPIGISHQLDLFAGQSILVNLTARTLDIAPLPQRLITLIPEQDETYKQQARQQYQQLKQAQHELHMHRI